jgi:cytoskeletal protein CcmA (bactofilin family)
LAGTVIGASLVVDGELTGADPVLVRGLLRGRVETSAAMVVEEGATVEADVHVRRLEVRGCVTGPVTAKELVDVRETARLVGDVCAPRVLIADGAVFRGNVDVET